MSEKRVRPKSTKEKDLKMVRVQIVGTRHNVNPESLKSMKAFFSMEGTFTIEETKNKRYRDWSLIKIVRAQKFSWDSDFRMVTRVLLTDSYSTQIINPSQEMPNGVEFETTIPRRITPKEAQTQIDSGAYIFALDENDNLKSLATARF
jgi:hypothetical protein